MTKSTEWYNMPYGRKALQLLQLFTIFPLSHNVQLIKFVFTMITFYRKKSDSTDCALIYFPPTL